MTNSIDQQIHGHFQTLLQSTNGRERGHARRQLLELDHTILIDSLVKMIGTTTDPETLAYAAELIVESEDKQRARLILPLLNSEDTLLRRHICGLLGNCGDRIAADPLIDRLREDPSSDVRTIAAYALGKIGERSALSALTWARDHDASVDFEKRSVHENAIKAINKIEHRSPSASDQP